MGLARLPQLMRSDRRRAIGIIGGHVALNLTKTICLFLWVEGQERMFGEVD